MQGYRNKLYWRRNAKIGEDILKAGLKRIEICKNVHDKISKQFYVCLGYVTEFQIGKRRHGYTSIAFYSTQCASDTLLHL